MSSVPRPTRRAPVTALAAAFAAAGLLLAFDAPPLAAGLAVLAGGAAAGLLAARPAPFDERAVGAALLNTSGALVLLLDREGRVLRASRAAELAGLPAAGAVGRFFWDVFAPAGGREEARAEFQRLLPGGSPVHTEGAGTAGRLVRWTHALAADAAGAPLGVLSIGLDVTESRALEAQLRQSQKMEALGRIAVGIAHDFNNLLTVVTGYSELLLGRLDRTLPEHGQIDAIHEAAARGALLTRQLLTFARRQAVEPVPLDLNELLRRLERTLLRLLGEEVRLETRLQTGLGAVLADPGQMQQVVLNLALNARDAMPRGGRLLLATERVDLDAPDAAAAGLARPGAYAALSVSDSGHGMDAAVRARLFEPFFTTKGPDRGTGLGLSTVYGIVRQAGGAVAVDSAPGQGATFRLLLPLAGAPAPVEAPPPAAPAAAGEGETVLVVEDSEPVRRLMRAALEDAGYVVLAAADGEAALRTSWEHRGPLHLLVTDVVLPGVGGRDLAKLLSLSRPDLRVLFASGSEGEARDVPAPLLHKPFSPAALAAKVREVLDRRPGAWSGGPGRA